MRQLIILLCTLFFSGCTKITELFPQFSKQNTQTGTSISEKPGADEFVCRYPIEPDFCDRQEWLQYLRDNLVLDDASLDTIPAGRYTVMAQFVINKNGDITDVLITHDPGYGLGKRVEAVIAHYKNRPIPSQIRIEADKSNRKQPVTFIVGEDEEEKISERN